MFCSNCGKKVEDNTNSKKCKYCHKKINPFNNRIWYYIKDHIKSDVDGKIYDFIIDFIKNHSYGFILSLTVVISIVAPGLVDKFIVNSKEVAQNNYIVMPTFKSSDEVLLKLEEYINSGNENNIKSLFYERNNKEVFDKYNSKTEAVIQANKDRFYLLEDYTYLLDHNPSFLNFGDESQYFEPGYHMFEEAGNLNDAGYNTKEYYVGIEYCSMGSVCTTDDSDIVFTILYYALMVEDNGNWYIYKMATSDPRMKWFIDYKGDADKINDDVMGGVL